MPEIPIFARVRPEKMKLYEEYNFKADISTRPRTHSVGSPTGYLKILVPYCGAGNFTQDAIADIEYQLHFSGHGEFRDNQGHLFLVGDSGKARSVDEETFSNLFLGTRRLGLIVLNACQSGTTSSRRALTGMASHLVRRGIPAVVAMQFPISDTIARIFADEFYHALALGWPVDAAMQATRNGIAMETGPDSTGFATPVLFLRAREGITLIDPDSLSPDAG